MATYVVKSGDNLSRIAQSLGVPVSSLSGYRSGNPNVIFAGENLNYNTPAPTANINNAAILQPNANPVNNNPVVPPPAPNTPAPNTPAPKKTLANNFGLGASPLNTEQDRLARSVYENSQKVPSASDIYSQRLQMYQGQIDSLNQLYNDRIASADNQQVADEGKQRAISFSRGIQNTPISDAQITQVRKNTDEIKGTINAQRSAEIGQLLGTARNNALQDAKDKETAKRAGAQDYIDYLKGASDRKKTNASAIISALAQKGVKVEDLSDAELKDLSDSLGFSPDGIKTLYEGEFAKLAKAVNPDTSIQKIGGRVLLIDKVTGKTINDLGADAGGDSLTAYQKFQATQAIAKDNEARTSKSQEIARQAGLITSSYQNIVNGGDKNLNTQAIIASFNKILDPSSTVREGEYDRTSEGQSLIAQLTAKVQNITAGGGGVTLDTLKEASDIGNQYLANAKKTIESQNTRAVNMANQFGLNSDFVTSTYSSNPGASNTPATPEQNALRNKYQY